MLKRLFNSAPQLPTYDPTLGDATAQRLLKLLDNRQTDPIFDYLEALREGEWDSRNWLLWLLAEHAPSRLLKAAPNTALGATTGGIVSLHLAWEARNSGLGDHAQELYGERLVTAVEHFKSAAEQDKEDPTPYANLVTAAMALRAEQVELHDIYHAAANRDAFNLKAHEMMLQAVCKKWGGQHTDMFSFANAIIEQAPAGSVLPLLWIQACIEQWFYFGFYDNDLDTAVNFLNNEEANTKATAVWDAFAQRTTPVASYEIPHLNNAAWWFYQTEDQARCKQALDLIDNRFTIAPWTHLDDDPAKAFVEAKAFAQK